MTNKTIALSREAILLVAREMDRLGYGHHESHAESLLYAALEADPVPPAGVEPEVRAAFDAWFIHDRALDPQTDTTLIDGPFEPWRAWKACADQYSAHVTRLQAEVERLKQVATDRKNELTKLCTECNDLQSELTKARELIQKISDTACGYLPEIKEYLSNQSAPADKGQGQPVGLQHMAVAEDGKLRWMPGRKMHNCELYALPDGSAIRFPLYSEQPAPVAVVLPERKSWDAKTSTRDYVMNSGYNLCIDDVARLNSEPKP